MGDTILHITGSAFSMNSIRQIFLRTGSPWPCSRCHSGRESFRNPRRRSQLVSGCPDSTFFPCHLPKPADRTRAIFCPALFRKTFQLSRMRSLGTVNPDESESPAEKVRRIKAAREGAASGIRIRPATGFHFCRTVHDIPSHRKTGGLLATEIPDFSRWQNQISRKSGGFPESKRQHTC